MAVNSPHHTAHFCTINIVQSANLKLETKTLKTVTCSEEAQHIPQIYHLECVKHLSLIIHS